ncbi:transposase [Morganella morganii]|uniref:transposase n=1 Tax=Morganella morganii TaxID=582 RepID=UPI0035C83645
MFTPVKTFIEEFKIEAIKQLAEHGYPVSEVASRLSVSANRIAFTFELDAIKRTSYSVRWMMYLCIN